MNLVEFKRQILHMYELTDSDFFENIFEFNNVVDQEVISTFSKMLSPLIKEDTKKIVELLKNYVILLIMS